MIIILGMLAVFYAIVIWVLYATRQKEKPSFEEYSVGGRAYGPWYVAMCYVNSWWPGTVFIAFFGISAGAGVFGLYGLAYSTFGIALMYFLATRAWRWGKRYELRSQPDLLALRFSSPTVRVVASIIGVVSLFPWTVLGMQALGEIFEIASVGAWSVGTCLVIGLVAIVVRQYWTVRMGMRGLIMTDMFQGLVAYAGAAAVCLVLLSGLAGGPISFAALAQVPAEILNVPGDGDDYGPWYLFSLIFTGVLGSMCWPTSFQRIYTASSVRSVKSGTLMTLLISGVFYTLLMLVGIAATSWDVVASDPQAGWFTLTNEYGGTWLLGLGVTMVFAASMGHVDASVQVSGLQVANDIVQSEKRPLTDKQLMIISKGSMVVYMILAAAIAYMTFGMERLQLLSQMAYQGIVQLAVPLFLGIFLKFGSKAGAVTGMIAGFVTAVGLTLFWPDDILALGSLTGGMVALGVNLLCYIVFSLIFPASEQAKARVDELFDVASRPAVTSVVEDAEEILDEAQPEAPSDTRPEAPITQRGQQ
ncbi:sodium:solute symporter [Citricoccus sp. GCM10030269]|uniref:sodium:solute symporter family protein n=1 Tax=Citricoccus sp. GCM10030269 TaxID=3273388 RepID=UPI0036097942